jgi:hypothetical protein
LVCAPKPAEAKAMAAAMSLASKDFSGPLFADAARSSNGRRVVSQDGFLGADNETLAYLVRLGVDRRQELAERPTHPVQLIDEVKNDANALVVHSEVALQIVNQLRPCHISFGKMLALTFSTTHQPTGRNPGFQGFGFKPSATKKFPMFHVMFPPLRPSCHLGRSATGS